MFESHRQPVELDRKADGSALTNLDIAVSVTLREALVHPGEGWISEEDEPLTRTSNKLCTWIVDPIDGTREYVMGIPEYSVSVAAWVNNEIAAGLIFNPMTGQIISGGTDNSLIHEPASHGSSPFERTSNKAGSIRMLVSRSEIEQDPTWQNLDSNEFTLIPCGSIAYKMGLMSVGFADAIVSLAPKSSWDISAGTILIRAAGGFVTDLSGRDIEIGEFRRVNGIISGREELRDQLLEKFAGK